MDMIDEVALRLADRVELQRRVEQLEAEIAELHQRVDSLGRAGRTAIDQRDSALRAQRELLDLLGRIVSDDPQTVETAIGEARTILAEGGRDDRIE